MPPKRIKIFLDTSVIIAAVMSGTGGGRALFHLANADAVTLVVGKSVLAEADEVIRRKVSSLLPLLAELLDLGKIEVSAKPPKSKVEKMRALVDYLPDARILAEAAQAAPDWFVTHDREHFLNNPVLRDLPFLIGTPGDVLLWLRENI